MAKKQEILKKVIKSIYKAKKEIFKLYHSL